MAQPGWDDEGHRDRIPTMKYVMTVALIAVAMLATPASHADPDPHKPDPGAHFCPGGGTVDAMSPLEPSCDGVPYDDGAYWRAINRGAPGTNSLVMVQCVKVGHWPQPAIPLPAPAGSCQ
jgi:hypothetical protein